jgi:N-acetyl-anhydromuramyl-L-alanine amidase AmpD
VTLNVPYIPARWHGGSQSHIRLIVMHCTVSPCKNGGARSIANYFATTTNKTSAHYVRDPSETIQCVYDHTVAYHCGTNSNSIGYELCDPMSGSSARWNDSNHLQMLQGAADDVAILCREYGIPNRHLTVEQIRAGEKGLCGHADMRDAYPGSTTHYDPGTDFPWTYFLDLVGGIVPPAILNEARDEDNGDMNLQWDSDFLNFHGARSVECGGGSWIADDCWVVYTSTFGQTEVKIAAQDGKGYVKWMLGNADDMEVVNNNVSIALHLPQGARLVTVEGIRENDYAIPAVNVYHLGYHEPQAAK